MDTSNKPVLVERAGKLTQNGYSIPKEYSGYEVFTNYKVALTKLGFEMQFECQERPVVGRIGLSKPSIL